MRINIFGGPGVGKSTTAALIFGWLRQHGHNAELAQGWVKAWAYQGRTVKSFDYVYTFANQLHVEDRLLRAGVEIVITDSPIPLQCIYADHAKMPAASALWQIADQFEKAHPSINLLVERTVPYVRHGRYQTEIEAREMDHFIIQCMFEHGIKYTSIPTSNLDAVLPHLEKQWPT